MLAEFLIGPYKQAAILHACSPFSIEIASSLLYHCPTFHLATAQRACKVNGLCFFTCCQ
uniref:Uncharacterized protein n=1 Tax=Arundo donax TaxID=35708 RepID=A0A0A9J878_ARUDO